MKSQFTSEYEGVSESKGEAAFYVETSKLKKLDAKLKSTIKMVNIYICMYMYSIYIIIGIKIIHGIMCIFIYIHI